MDTVISMFDEIENDRSVVETELKRLLQDKRFASAPMMSAFLQYIVTQKLEGNAQRIKAYSIGVDALGKPVSFDAQHDPSVRVLALRLRKTLKAVYESSSAGVARIDIKVGTYVPEFYKIKALQITAHQPAAHGIDAPVFRETDTAVVHEDNTAAKGLPISNTRNGRQLPESGPEHSFRHDPSDEERPTTVASTRWTSDTIVLSACTLLAGMMLFQSGIVSMGDTIKRAPTLVKSDQLPIHMAGLNTSEQLSGSPDAVPTPTIYLLGHRENSPHVQKISVLLGASIGEGGLFNVVFALDEKTLAAAASDDYTLLVSEVAMATGPRVDAQILRAGSGELVRNWTLNFDSATDKFTEEEKNHISGLAMDISGAEGFVYQDFCNGRSTLTKPRCQNTRELTESAVVSHVMELSPSAEA